MPFFILLFLFVFIPFAEISLLLNVSSSIGGLNTILIVLVTAILGAYLVRQQGFSALTKVQQQMAQNKVPALEIAEGVLLLFAGAVLVTPGFITDFIGFTLLVPHVRSYIVRWLSNRAVWKMQVVPGESSSASKTIIEGEYSDDG